MNFPFRFNDLKFFVKGLYFFSRFPNTKVLLDNLLSPKGLPNSVIIMAGGLGKRLGKLTENTPKPMLPIDGIPMIEIIIRRYKNYGFKNSIELKRDLGKILNDNL